MAAGAPGLRPRRCCGDSALPSRRVGRRCRRSGYSALAAVAATAVATAAAAAGAGDGAFLPAPPAARLRSTARQQGRPSYEPEWGGSGAGGAPVVEEATPAARQSGAASPELRELEGLRARTAGRRKPSGLGWKIKTPLRALARARNALRNEALSWAAIFIIGAFGLFGSTAFLKEQASNQAGFNNQVFEQWYARATEASKKATRLAQRAQETWAAGQAAQVASDPAAKAPKSIVSRIRSVASTLDNCQSDLYNEQWKALDTYPLAFRSYVQLLESYVDAALPSPGTGTPEELIRSSLQFETERFSRGVDAFRDAVGKRSIRDVERSYAEMSLAYDRYLKAGNLYTGYDPVTSTEVFYRNIDDSRLVYTPKVLEQPRIRDEVLVTQGPDKGKIGQVIWLGKDSQDADKVLTAVVKMDPNPNLGVTDVGRGFREVKSYPYPWIVVTRSSDLNLGLDILLGALAALFSCALTYPLDSIKSRIQAGMPLLPSNGVVGLFEGLTFNLLREVPNQAIYLGGFNYLTQKFCLLVDANNPSLKFLVMIPAGILAFAAGTPFRAPFEVLNKQIQTGQAKTDQEAIDNVFFKPAPEEVAKTMQTALILCLVRGALFGAFQCTLYEIFKDKWELVQYGFPLWSQPFVWGAAAGALTGVVTNPPDVLLTRLSQEDTEYKAGLRPKPNDDTFQRLFQAAQEVQEKEGLDGFLKGASARALYFAPEACLWFAAYEQLKGIAGAVLAEF